MCPRTSSSPATAIPGPEAWRRRFGWCASLLRLRCRTRDARCPMTAWTDEELGRIGEAQELQLASERPDGTLRPYVTMWVVRVDDELYVRSAHGANNPWLFVRAKASGVGRIR